MPPAEQLTLSLTAPPVKRTYRPAVGKTYEGVPAHLLLRIHFLPHWFELSDPAAEEVLYDSRAMRQFVGIDLASEPVPDETTIGKFRHLNGECDSKKINLISPESTDWKDNVGGFLDQSDANLLLSHF